MDDQPDLPLSSDNSHTPAATGTRAPADALQSLADMLGDDWDEITAPVHWPSLSGEEAPAEWDALRRWVTRLRVRYPNQVRLPDCWWQHSDLVEALAALRDHERASYAATAPPTGAVEWHRALRDITALTDAWTKRFSCTVTDRGHQPPTVTDAEPDGWHDWVRADATRRSTQAQEVGS